MLRYILFTAFNRAAPVFGIMLDLVDSRVLRSAARATVLWILLHPLLRLWTMFPVSVPSLRKPALPFGTIKRAHLVQSFFDFSRGPGYQQVPGNDAKAPVKALNHEGLESTRNKDLCQTRAVLHAGAQYLQAINMDSSRLISKSLHFLVLLNIASKCLMRSGRKIESE